MASLQDQAASMREALIAAYGRSEPPFGSFEPAEAVIAAAIEQLGGSSDAVERLRDAGLLDLGELAAADATELSEVLQRGRSRPKPGLVGTLIRLAQWAVESGGIETILDRDTESLRHELRSLKGIGASTADAILLHSLQRPTIPISRGSYRIFVRHGWLDTSADEEEARTTIGQLATGADNPPLLLADWSNWLDRLGQRHCRPRTTDCSNCPLAPFLPEGGPLEPEPLLD